MKPKKIPASFFLSYVLNKEHKRFLQAGLIIGVLYFIFLRILFPVPSYYSDSYTYIQVARDYSPVSFRPAEYSELINFFKRFSSSEFALIAGQYFSSLFANLFLFFTCTYFFTFKKVYKFVLFILLVCNPIYLLSSNYILTDSFFSSFTVTWFTMLIWMMHKPKWYYIIIQMLLLLLLFKLRYNAIYYPMFMALAIVLANDVKWRKAISISAGFIMVFLLVFNTTNKNEQYTGTRTFSAFSGWQLANNALHILPHKNVVIKKVEDEEVQEVIDYSKSYLDAANTGIDTNSVSAGYMWLKSSPLKQYLVVYNKKYRFKTYFAAWYAIGPVYNNFGKAVILQKPLEYCKYFVLPNIKDYFLPPLEAYNEYNENKDTIAPIARAFYKYKSNKAGSKHPGIYSVAFKPWKYIFPIINLLFIGLALFYVFTKQYKKTNRLFNHTLLCFSSFYIGNFFFVVLLAPTVFRYHIFIITLAFPVILYLMQQMLNVNEVRADNNSM